MQQTANPQTLAFRSPAAVGEALRAEVTVTKRSGSRVTFQTTCATGSCLLSSAPSTEPPT